MIAADTRAKKTAVAQYAKNEQSTSKKGLKKALKIISIVLLILLVLGVPSSFAFAYKDRIYPNIKIAGVQVGGLTASEAKAKLDAKAKELSSQSLNLIIDGQSHNPKLEELGITFDTGKAISSATEIGRKNSWQLRAKQIWELVRNGYRIELPMATDEKKLDFYIESLNNSVTKKPVNATLSIQNGTVYLVQAQDGFGLNKESLKKEIKKLINKGSLAETISLPLEATMPDVKDQDTAQAMEISKNYLAAAPLVVTYQDKSWTADINEISSWISYSAVDNKLAVSIDFSGFITRISKNVEVRTIDREVEEGGKIVVEGQDGLGIDENILSSEIKDALVSGKPSTVTLPVFDIPRQEKTVYPHAQPGRYPGRYVDINLSEQKLYAFEGATEVKSFLISSGKRGYATPTGEFSVYGKSRSTLMDGPDYYLPNVEWVSWFYGDYSIHGTYWHHNFGHVMSHGCVNASNEDAEWLYNWDDIGTPVYVHY